MKLYKPPCMRWIINYIKSNDEIVKPVAYKMHIEGKKNTFVGGCTYLSIVLFLCYIVVKRTMEMIGYH